MIKINKSSSKRTLTLQKILNSNFFSYSTRQKIIVVFIYFFIFLIVAKLINLQIFQHSNKDKFVNDFAYKKIEELQQRGDILDRNKEILVMSIKTYDLAIDAGILSDLKFIENLLSKYDIKLSPENYEAIKNKKRYISIKKDISYNTIYNLKQDISKYKETNKQKIKELRKLIKKN